MKCQKCNEEIKDDVKFCSNCGTKIADDFHENYIENNRNNKNDKKTTDMTWLKAIGTVISGWGVFLIIVNYIELSKITDRMEFGIAWTFKYQRSFTSDFFMIIGGLILIGIAFAAEKK